MQLAPQPWMNASSKRVLAAVAAAGGEARYVGGCVRDALLERPSGDVDMACTLPPEQTMSALEQAGIKAIPTGIAHGTVTGISDSVPYELTTLRRDVACNGRHAEVAFTDDWREDAARRDFTMNALYADAEGNITDYFDGAADAKAGRVRFIGDAGQRIEEDALRILRFFRFFAHYGKWPMDSAALAACENHAAMLEALSGERIQAEMHKLLVSPIAADVLEVMHERGILRPLGITHPHVTTLRKLDSQDAVLRLAALLRGDDVEAVVQRWKHSNEDKFRLRELRAVDVQPMATWDEWKQKKMLRRLGKSRFTDSVKLAMAEHSAERSRYTPLMELAQNWQIPQFPVSGQDLLLRGMPQGKELGEVLRELETRWESERYIPTKDELLAKL